MKKYYKSNILILIIIVYAILGCDSDINDSQIQNPYIKYTYITTRDGKKLDFAIVAPETLNNENGNPVLIAFPPGDQTSDEVVWTLDNYLIRQSIQRNWIAISPMQMDGKKYFEGAENYIPELFDWVEDNYSVENSKYHISGISNGGKSAFRIAIKFRKRCSSLLVFPGIIHSSNEYAMLDSLMGIPVHMYVGEYETQAWISVMDSIKTVLDDLGVYNQYITFPGDGHVITSLTSKMLFDTLDSFRTNLK